MSIANKKYSVAEYLELEKNSEIRHEYYYGKLIKMPRESKQANLFANNLLVNWQKDFRKKGNLIFTHDVKVETVKKGVYRYPDLVVAPQTDNDDDYIVKQPLLIVEVASELSMATDSKTKLREYSAIETLQYYIIISQDEKVVQFNVRDGKRWYFEVLAENYEVLELPVFETTITIGDIYDGIKFAEPKSG